MHTALRDHEENLVGTGRSRGRGYIMIVAAEAAFQNLGQAKKKKKKERKKERKRRKEIADYEG